MADGNVTITTAANFIPEMWRDAILDYAERKFVLRNQVSDFSSMLAGGGDILNIPKVAEDTAAAKSAGSAVTYQNNTDGVIQLALDQHHYEAKRIEDIVKVQESADLFNAYVFCKQLPKSQRIYLIIFIMCSLGYSPQFRWIWVPFSTQRKV